MTATTVTSDVLLAVAVAGLVALAWLVVHVVQQTVRVLTPALPALPDEDCAPDGLGRLVPVGAQVEQEVRRGVVALELWLVAHRRRTTRSDGGRAPLPRPRPARADREAAREAG